MNPRFVHLWVVILVAPAIFCSQVLLAQPAGTPQIDPLDPHRFIVDGQQWYPSGSYPNLAALTVRTDGLSLTTYHQTLHNKLQANGLNYYRCVFTFGQPYAGSKNAETLPYNRSSTPGAADGGNKFDLSSWNAAHFTYWRNVVEDAGNKGLVVQFCILESWHINKWDHGGGWGLKYDFYIGQNNINGLDVGTEANWHSTTHAVYDYQKAIVRKVVDELGDLPNIIWEVCNEPKPYYYSWAMPLGDYLKSYELSSRGYNHVCMPVDLPDHQYCPGNQNVSDIPLLHTDLVARFSSNEVLIADNDTGTHYLNKHNRRKRAWAAFSAGAHNDYFQLSMGELSTLNSADIAEGMQYMGYVHQFISAFSVNLGGMVPSDGLVSNGWCYARSGDEYIIYLISGGSTTVSNLPASYDAYWFNPRTAVITDAGTGPTFTPPFGDDASLHIVQSGRPVAVIAADPAIGLFPLEVDFDGTGSYDPDGGSIVSYEWDFENDGSIDSTLAIDSHVYSDPYSYVASLKVTDDENQTRTATVNIQVVAAIGDFDIDGDVDQEDFGHLQECMMGTGNPQNDPSCLDARLDEDDDVDLEDFTMFENCMSGANIPQTSPSCIPS
ncbi:MAG: PKD domain-containing protein [Planctomycetota bacterium]